MALGTTYPQRKNIRLSGYNYALPGHYFVTMVTADRAPHFADAERRCIVDHTWLWLAENYLYVELDEHVVMPNHLHGIVIIRTNALGDSAPKPLGRLIGAFKTISTKRINEVRGTPGLPLWQRSFHERIIRNDRELNAIRQYTIDNPAKWNEDKNNPASARIAAPAGRSRTAPTA